MKRKGLTLYIHIGCWLLFTFFIAAFLNNSGRNNSSWPQTILSLPFLLFVLFYVLVFYLNMYVLMPGFFLKKKYLAYTLIFIALFAACFYVKPFEHVMQDAQRNSLIPAHLNEANNRAFPRPPDLKGESRFTPIPGAPMNRPPVVQNRRIRMDIISLILFFMTMAGSAMLVLSKQWRVTEENKSLVEIQKVKAELAFLKAQVSPHFLFNTLNNIYALAITKSEHTASGILHLSNIMRYVTDEAKEDFVPVEQEIACINDFIALQKLRLGKKVTLDYTATGEYGNTKVAPLILMAFIENAFKHGVSNNIPSYIRIAIHVDERNVSLRTENTIIKDSEKDNRDGIGLLNAKQRLDLLYPGLHRLQMSGDKEKFTVVLTLDNIPA